MIKYEDTELNENYEEISFELIEYYVKINKFAKTIELVHEQLADHIENSRLWFILGYSHLALREYDQSEEELKEALRLGYSEELVYYTLGHIYLETGRWKRAEEVFLKSLRSNPNNEEVLADYALLMKIMGHRIKARRLINKARELAPENDYVVRRHFILEGINSSKKQRVLALEQYMNSNDSELYKLLNLGAHAIFHNKEKEAQEYFRQAFLLNPEDKKIFSLLEDFELEGHPLLIPNRLVERVGGPAVVWLIGIVIYISLIVLEFNSTATLFIQCFFVFGLYTWISRPLVRVVKKIRRYKNG
ncbi:tetratricopeptide repeat protein [Lysinibacillus capsici]|uniref:tetratricopeptide repeat protein n=1 Tax=Lysinibacillus TaxID=400634 RepID=UPI002798C868|nr:tetratricopeptide repeat protein [Lysinibacillus capsici]WHP42675.1 tetratricopeptide repeat protein [Lysinibacillus boronitolerans]